MTESPADASSDLMARYRGVPALVLGASGFIGAWVARTLDQHGAILHTVVRTPGSAPAGHVTIADLAREGSIAAVLARVRPAIVFNLAGYGVDHSERDSASMDALNSRLVSELCEALRTLASDAWTGLRLVHVGSALEYGAVSGTLAESMTPNPTTDYGRTKLAGTERVIGSAASGLRATVARPFTVYGPGEHSGRLLPSLLTAAKTGGRVGLSHGRQRRDFTYVEDVAEGLLRLGINDRSQGQIVNLATGVLTSVRTFAETAAAVFELEPASLDFGAVRVRDEEMFHGDVDVARLKQVLAWWPRTSVADGIRRTWEIERGQ